MNIIESSMTTESFLSGGGEMGELIRRKDWSKTSLGDVKQWPQSLKTCIRIILTSRQPMFVWWGKDLINIYNDAYLSIIGGKHPVALGQPASEVWHEIWDQVGPRAEMVMRENEGTYDEALLLIMERNGYPEETYYTFSYSPVPGDQGGTDGIICANTDDTQRIIVERQLRTLKDIGKNLIDSKTPQDVYENAVRVLLENPQDFPFAALYEVSENGQRLSRVKKYPETLSEAFLPAVIDTKKSNDFPVFRKVLDTAKIDVQDGLIHTFGDLPSGPWAQSPDRMIVIPITGTGRKYPYAVIAVGMNPYRLPDEKYISFFQLAGDQISTSLATVNAYEQERKRAEALAEIDKAKTVFFSNISHEFRTPLTLMLGPLEELLNSDKQLLPEQLLNIETTHRNALRLLKLVNALLDFSRIESGRVQANFQPVDIVSFTKDIASSFRSVIEKAGLKFNIHSDEINEEVIIDKDMWEKIVLNLLSNSFKYTLEGSIDVYLKTSGGQLLLEVADTGIGIPEKEIPNLFQRFHRVETSGGRTYEGTGIGLSFIQELVKLHDGKISVKSKFGKGSVFTVAIPIIGRQVQQVVHPVTDSGSLVSEGFLKEASVLVQDAEQPVNLKSETGETHRHRIMVVDDNADMRTYISHLLKDEFIIETATNGKEAYEKILQDPPHLIISDVMMPVMNGIELLQLLKKHPQTMRIPVILLSARAGEEAKIEGYNTGADDYLVKPFSSKELIARVNAQIRNSNTRKHIEGQVSRLFMDAPVALAIFRGPQFIVDVANKYMLQFWRRTEGEVLYKPIFDVLPEVRQQGLEKLLKNVFEKGKRYVVNEVPVEMIRNGEQETVYIKYVCEPLLEEDGKVNGVMVLADEITEQVKARKKLEESEEQLRLATEGTQLATWDLNLKTRKITYSPRLAVIFGHPETAMLTHEDLRNQLETEDRETIVEPAFLKAMKTGVYEYEARIIKPDKKQVWIRTQGKVYFNEQGQPHRMLGTMMEITELKEAEEKLGKLAAIVESSSDAIVSKTLQGIITSWNKGAEAVFGYTSEEMIGKHISTLIPKERLSEEDEIISKIKAGKPVTHFDTKRMKKNGEIIDISLTISPITDKKGKIIGASKVAREITDKIKAIKILEEAEQRQNLALASAELGAWDLDYKTGKTIRNLRHDQLFGYADFHPDWNFDIFLEHVHPDDRAAVEHAVEEGRIKGNFSFETRIIRTDEKILWIKVQGRIFYDQDNEPIRMLGTMMDISEQKLQSEKLEQMVEERTSELLRQKEFVETILDSTVDVVAVLNTKLEYMSLNKKAMEMYHLSGKNIIGKHILELFPLVKYSGMYADLQKALKGKTIHNPQYKSPVVNRHFENFYIPLKNAEGEIYGVLMIGHENTAIVEAAEKLRSYNQALEEKNVALERSNKELESFSYVASHDLQEPLRKIQTFADLLRNNHKNEELAERYLDKIKSSSQRMSDLIKAVLNYSRLSRTQTEFEEVDLNIILEEVKTDFELLIFEKKVQIKSDPLPVINGIQLQLNQLFSNLISNSIKFSDKDPEIRITSRLLEHHEVKAIPELNSDLQYFEIRIKDNGIGFEQQYADKIFTIFQRLHDKLTYVGTGIGLALCRKIVQTHGGIIRAESELGKGAEFIICLPAHQQP